MSAVSHLFKSKETIQGTEFRNIHFIENTRTEHVKRLAMNFTMKYYL